MNKLVPVLPLLLVLLAFSACRKTPSWVIPQDKIEDVLIDIHIAEGIIDNQSGEFPDYESKQELFNAVYKKHGITKQDFDTSLVWYAAHLKDFLKIYEDIDKRMLILRDTVEQRLTALSELEAKGINIWQGSTVAVISSFAHNNIFTFQNDSLLSAGGAYRLKFSLLGVDSALHTECRFCIEAKDTILVKKILPEKNGDYSLDLTLADHEIPKILSGSVYIDPLQVSDVSLIIANISLCKYKEASALSLENPGESANKVILDDITVIKK